MPISECQWFGVAVEMASISFESSIFLASVKVLIVCPVFESESFALPSTAASTSHSPVIFTPVIFSRSLMCDWPRLLKPIMPTRISLFGDCERAMNGKPSADAASAEVLMK